MGISDLAFLVGTWRGEGVAAGDRVTASVVGAQRDGDSIELAHETVAPGAPVHRERIVLREKRGRTFALVRPQGGAEQEFRLADAGPPLRFVHRTPRGDEIAWEIEPRGPDAYAERFFAPVDGKTELVVDLVHQRVRA